MIWNEETKYEKIKDSDNISLDVKTVQFPLTILKSGMLESHHTSNKDNWESGCVENWSYHWYEKFQAQSVSPRIFWNPLKPSVWKTIRGHFALLGGEHEIYGYIDSSNTYFLVYNYNNNIIVSVYKINKKEDCFNLIQLTVASPNMDICNNCFNLTDKHKLKLYKNKLVCLKCFKYITAPCSCCQESFIRPNVYTSLYKQSKLIKLDSVTMVCDNCARKRYMRCHRCRNYVKKSENNTIGGYLRGEEWYCTGCFSELAFTCQECATITHIQDTIMIGRRRVCRDCASLLQTIQHYNYIPKFKFNKMKGDNLLFLGVELELETNTESDCYEECAKLLLDYVKTLKAQDYYYIKHDGSIAGFELVCHPATLRYMHKNYKWQQILKFCVKQGWTSYKSGHCGLHVHLDRTFFTQLQKKAFRLFFSTNSYFLCKFGKREGINMRFCQYEDFKIADFMKNETRQETKYYAYRTNPNGKETVELRIFRGTLNYDRFLATLQFCDALSHFIKSCSVMICGSKKSWIEFINWTKQMGRYTHFITYIQDKNKLLSTET